MVSTMTLNIVQSYIKNHPWELSYAGLINFGTFGVSSTSDYHITVKFLYYNIEIHETKLKGQEVENCLLPISLLQCFYARRKHIETKIKSEQMKHH